MDELGLRHRVEQHLEEVGDLHAHGIGIEPAADGMLHPGIGDQDPEGREIGADGDAPGHGQVADAAELVPAEEEQADEGGLEEEGHQPLDGQRRTEHVADIVRVIGPVGAELELHGDAGRHPHGEVDAEQDAPEHGHVAPDLAAGHDVDALHDRQQQRQPQRQRHEQEMVHRGERELQAGEVDDLEVNHWVPLD